MKFEECVRIFRPLDSAVMVWAFVGCKNSGGFFAPARLIGSGTAPPEPVLIASVEFISIKSKVLSTHIVPRSPRHSSGTYVVFFGQVARN